MNKIISYGYFPIKELNPHKNKGMEITYVEKGMMEWMVEGQPEKVEAGSVFFTLPWQVHGSLLPKEPENAIWHVLFHLELDYSTPQTLFSFTHDLGFSAEEMGILSKTFASSEQHSFRATTAMRGLMPALITELQSTHDLREAHANTLLRAVLVELKRIVAGNVVDAETHSLSEQRVQDLITDLSANCGQHWTLSSMAQLCGIRRTQLGKLFQRLTNSTPTEFLFRIRIERAKTQLRRTNFRVIDIAYDCGYGSSQYFANAFKQTVGMTPTEYRKFGKGLTGGESSDWKKIQFRSEDEELRRVKAFSEKPAQ